MGLVGAALVATAGLLVAACGSSSGSSSMSEAAQDRAIAEAIAQVGPHRAKLGSAALNQSMLEVTMSVKGIGQADIACYLPIALPAFGPKFATLNVHDITVWLSDTDGGLPIAARESAEKCFSNESLARLKDHEIAPDVSYALARQVLPIATTKDAVGVGLTAAEADCYTHKIYDGLTDAQMKAGFEGQVVAGVPQPEPSIKACVTAKRRASLGPKMAQLVAQQQAADQAEHERTQESIDAALRASLASTTTVP